MHSTARASSVISAFLKLRHCGSHLSFWQYPNMPWKRVVSCQAMLCYIEIYCFFLRSLIDKQRRTRQKGKAGKLYCCFVDFKKAFDTVPRAVLWQVLEELGVCGRILDIINSLYAHDNAAVRSTQGLSATFRCLMGVKQGCPLSPTLFGLYVDGLENHLLETADIDAPTLRGVLEPLLLYAV